MAGKKKNKRLIVASAFLITSIILVFYAGYRYLMEFTNFSRQADALVEGIVPLIPQSIWLPFYLGVMVFIIFFIFLSKRRLEMIVNFLLDMVLPILSGTLLILGVFLPRLRVSFRVYFIISSLVFYYSNYIAKEAYASYFKNRNKKPRGEE